MCVRVCPGAQSCVFMAQSFFRVSLSALQHLLVNIFVTVFVFVLLRLSAVLLFDKTRARQSNSSKVENKNIADVLLWAAAECSRLALSTRLHIFTDFYLTNLFICDAVIFCNWVSLILSSFEQALNAPLFVQHSVCLLVYKYKCTSTSGSLPLQLLSNSRSFRNFQLVLFSFVVWNISLCSLSYGLQFHFFALTLLFYTTMLLPQTPSIQMLLIRRGASWGCTHKQYKPPYIVQSHAVGEFS